MSSVSPQDVQLGWGNMAPPSEQPGRRTSGRAGEERPSFFCPGGAVQGSLRWFVLWVCAEGHGLLLQLLQL